MLSALHDSNAAVSLHTLNLRHCDPRGKITDYCDLSGEGSSDLLWAILQKAHNLRQIQLPDGFMDIQFNLSGVMIKRISEDSKQFITFLST